MTRDQVVEILKKRQGNLSQMAFAERLGISQGHLNQIYTGKKEPGASVLSKLGLTRTVERIITYRKAS
jgi:transcriptional regulator with XRE-family HTH domain